MVEMHFCESGNLDQSRVYMLRTIFTRIRYGLSRVKNRSTFFFTFLTKRILSKKLIFHHKSTCPATDLCPKLTGDLYGCDDVAERTDPHYGPGSGKSTSTTKPSPNTKISCQESLMKQYQQQCYQLFHDCFGPFSEPLVHDVNFRLGFGGGFILLFVISAFVSLSTLGGGLEYDKKKRRKRRKMLRLRNQKLKTI